MRQFLSENGKRIVERHGCKKYEKIQIAIEHFDGQDVIRTSLIDGDNVGAFKANWIGFMEGTNNANQ